MEPGTRQIRARLSEAAQAELVGREREKAQLRQVLETAAGPAVVFVSGPGGIGKSILVRGFLATSGLNGVVVDGQDLEPTPAGMLRGLSGALGLEASTAREFGAAAAAVDLRVLVIDSFERLNLVDGWLRNELLVDLPGSVTTVLVGRRPPNVAWRTSPGWRQLLAELVVGPLSSQDAQRLVGRRQLPADVGQRVLHFGRGHPLALVLAAEAFSRHPDLALPEGPPAEVVEELFEVLLHDLGAADREMVEAASILRRITQPLLASVLAREDAESVDIQSAWQTLRALPFVTTTPTGLRLQAVAHNVIADGLEIRDPAKVQLLRRRAASAVLRSAEDGRSWDATADLLFLVQNPIIRNSYVPPGDQQHPVEQALADDLPAIVEITEKFDGATGARLIQAWWDSHRDRFVVGRGAEGEVTAYSVVVRLSEVDRGLVRQDPVLQAFLDDVAKRPIPPDDDCLLHRRALGARRGELQSPELGAMVIDIKRQYLELRSVLRRTYAPVADWPALGQLLRTMGFERLDPALVLGERSVQPCVLDFGPGGVDGWLLRHVLVETEGPRLERPASASSEHPHAPRDGGPTGQLSAREREVMAVLAEGLTNLEIAERLFISERTANRHLSNIFTKLGVRNRTAAARMAIEAGLVG